MCCCWCLFSALCARCSCVLVVDSWCFCDKAMTVSGEWLRLTAATDRTKVPTHRILYILHRFTCDDNHEKSHQTTIGVFSSEFLFFLTFNKLHANNSFMRSTEFKQHSHGVYTLRNFSTLTSLPHVLSCLFLTWLAWVAKQSCKRFRLKRLHCLTIA